jgi:hypothetical protein
MKFNPDKPTVIASPVTIFIHQMVAGDPLSIVETETPEVRGAVTVDLAERLWASGKSVYAEDFRPTPVETPEQEAARVVEMDDLGNGRYLIRAPWLGKSEKVRGQAKAQARYAAVVAAGPQPIPDPELDEPGETEVVAPPPPPPPPPVIDPPGSATAPADTGTGAAAAVVANEPAGGGEQAEG